MEINNTLSLSLSLSLFPHFTLHHSYFIYYNVPPIIACYNYPRKHVRWFPKVVFLCVSFMPLASSRLFFFFAILYFLDEYYEEREVFFSEIHDGRYINETSKYLFLRVSFYENNFIFLLLILIIPSSSLPWFLILPFFFCFSFCLMQEIWRMYIHEHQKNFRGGSVFFFRIWLLLLFQRRVISPTLPFLLSFI